MAKEGEKRPVRIKSDSIKLIRKLLSPRIVKKEKFLWQEIVAAIADITKTQTKGAEDILANLLKLEGPIQLAPNSDIPSVMSPEDMLKFIAIETLGKWTGRKHLDAFRKIYATTQSSTLSGIAKVHIERLGGELGERKQ